MYLLDIVHEELNRAKSKESKQKDRKKPRKSLQLDSAKYSSEQKELESQSIKEW